MSVAASTLPRTPQRDPFAIFLFVSLLLHLLLFLFMPYLKHQQLAPPQEQFAEVELLPPPPTPPAVAKPLPSPPVQQAKPEDKEKKEEEKPQQRQEPLQEQIVNPPDNANDQIPEKTRLLSDRNSSTKEQTVAVGTPVPAPPRKEKVPAKEKSEKPETPKPPTQLAMNTPEAKPLPKPPLAKALEKLGENPTETPHKTEQQQKDLAPGKPNAPARTPQLFARPDELLTQGWLSNAGHDKEEQKSERQPPQGRDLIALAPPPAESLLSLPGPIGTPDLLPDVRQGSLTFLNTKAHRFAPFVRRVAMRVFQHLIIYQRKQLSLDEVIAAKDMVTVQAKLDTHGNLTKLIIQTRSGSHAVDSSLLEACKQGAWDENPPPEAQAEDGSINFVFRSDIAPQYDQIGLRAIVSVLQVGLL